MAPDREIMKNLLLLATRSTYVLAKSVAGLEKENNAQKKKMLARTELFPLRFFTRSMKWERARSDPAGTWADPKFRGQFVFSKRHN